MADKHGRWRDVGTVSGSKGPCDAMPCLCPMPCPPMPCLPMPCVCPMPCAPCLVSHAPCLVSHALCAKSGPILFITSTHMLTPVPHDWSKATPCRAVPCRVCCGTVSVSVSGSGSGCGCAAVLVALVALTLHQTALSTAGLRFNCTPSACLQLLHGQGDPGGSQRELCALVPVKGWPHSPVAGVGCRCFLRVAACIGAHGA